MNHPNLSINDDLVKAYIPLPSGTALEQQKLRMSEEDWLGSVLFSLFQESTVKFYDQCKDFYNTVEEKYDIKDFFRSWEAHIQVDLDYGHENHFSDFLESDETCSREEVVRSFYNTLFTFEFLLNCLDEILDADTGDEPLELRNPIAGGRVTPENTSLLRYYRGVSGMTYDFEGEDGLGFMNRLHDMGLRAAGNPEKRSGEVQSSDAEFLFQEFISQFYKCVSNASQHDDLMLFGRLIELTSLDHRRLQSHPYSSYTIAISNFFNELVGTPSDFAFLLYHLKELTKSGPVAGTGGWLSLEIKGEAYLEEFLKRQIISTDAKDRMANLVLRFNEIYEKWIAVREDVKPVNFFRY